jgi:hypothetical protein
MEINLIPTRCGNASAALYDGLNIKPVIEELCTESSPLPGNNRPVHAPQWANLMCLVPPRDKESWNVINRHIKSFESRNFVLAEADQQTKAIEKQFIKSYFEAFFRGIFDYEELFDERSIREIRTFGAFIVGDEKRRNGLSVCSHWVGVMIFTYVYLRGQGKTHEEAVVGAFVGYAHDMKEDRYKLFGPLVAARTLSHVLWQGAGRFRQKIFAGLRGLNDNPNLHGNERLEDQVFQALADKTGLVTPVRLGDKIMNLIGDIYVLENGQHPYKDLEDCVKPIVSHFKRYEKVVQWLPVNDLYKRVFLEMIGKLAELTRQEIAHLGAKEDRKDYLFLVDEMDAYTKKGIAKFKGEEIPPPRPKPTPINGRAEKLAA